MMFRPIMGAALLTLPLAACGQSQPTAEAQNVEVVSQPSPKGGYENALRTMPVGQRNATLYRAIADAGRTCQEVDSSEAVGTVDGQPAWSATCHDGVTWIVVIGKNGMAAVTNAAELQAAQKGS